MIDVRNGYPGVPHVYMDELGAVRFQRWHCCS